MLVGAGLKLEAVRYVVCLALPAPLDSLLPSLAFALARRLDRRTSAASQLVADQIVVAARKPGGTRG